MKAYIAGVGETLELTEEHYDKLNEFARLLECMDINAAVERKVIRNQMLLFRRVSDCAGAIDFVFIMNEPGAGAKDIAKSLVSKWLSLPLKTHKASYNRIKQYCEQQQVELTREREELAMLPEGCIVVDECPGIVPAYIINADSTIFFFLPHEVSVLEELLEECILPIICGMTEQYLATEKVVTYNSCEKALDMQLDILVDSYPVTWKQEIVGEETHISFTAAGATPKEAGKLAGEMADLLVENLDLNAWREDNVDFAKEIRLFVKEKKLKISAAVWCQNGKETIALQKALIDNFPFSIDGKDKKVREKVLGVPPQYMEENGGANAGAAMYMAANVLDVDNTPLGVSIILDSEGGTFFWGLSDGKSACCGTHRIGRGNEEAMIQSVQRYLLYALKDALSEYPEQFKGTVSQQELLYSPGVNVVVSGFSREAIRKWAEDIPLPKYLAKYRDRI